MEQNTQITVLLPVYNAEKYLLATIDSILNQTFQDFELLIINDGSTDNTEEIILSYKDARIRYIKNETNLKLIATLNKGFDLANGKYIARMDADDIMLPNRLEEQYKFMEENPEYGVCGSLVKSFGDGFKSREVQYETEHDDIKFRLLFDTHFPHPTAFLRTETIRKYQLYFEKEYIHAEDFIFWNRLAKVSKIKILPLVLLKKRIHQGQVSTLYNKVQIEIANKIRGELLQEIGIELSHNDIKVWNEFLLGRLPEDNKKLNRLLYCLEQLKLLNEKKKIYNRKRMSDFVDYWYWQVCANSTQFGMRAWRVFKENRMKVSHLKTTLQLKFYFKCLIKYRGIDRFTPIIHT